MRLISVDLEEKQAGEISILMRGRWRRGGRLCSLLFTESFRYNLINKSLLGKIQPLVGRQVSVYPGGGDMSYYLACEDSARGKWVFAFLFVCRAGAGAVSRLVLSVMMPEAEQSVLSCDQLCGSATRLLNSLGTPGLPSHTATAPL